MIKETRTTEKKAKELTPAEELQEIKKNQELIQTAMAELIMGGM